MRRTAMEDTELGGQHIKKGDKILLHYHSANHDEDVFGEDAMDFDVTRAERMPDLYNQLRSFGIGQHFCIGTHLARLELNIMFEEIISRLRNPQTQGRAKVCTLFFRQCHEGNAHHLRPRSSRRQRRLIPADANWAWRMPGPCYCLIRVTDYQYESTRGYSRQQRT